MAFAAVLSLWLGLALALLGAVRSLLARHGPPAGAGDDNRLVL